ncbi:MAG: hypothetical protein ACI9BW_002412 [Gammaproteobacteria bacterium]|jgi:hypothetical protein
MRGLFLCSSSMQFAHCVLDRGVSQHALPTTRMNISATDSRTRLIRAACRSARAVCAFIIFIGVTDLSIETCSDLIALANFPTPLAHQSHSHGN